MAIILKRNRDCFLECEGKDLWRGLKIQLLDTAFWGKLSRHPKTFNEKYRARVKLFEYDFLVVPMFEWYGIDLFTYSPLIFFLFFRNHWKLGIVENPGDFINGNA